MKKSGSVVVSIFGAKKPIVGISGNSELEKASSVFWTLAGSLASKIKLSNKNLRKTRQKFSEDWGGHWK